MDYYFLIITVIDIFVLGIMCVLTGDNETLNKQKKQWFIRSFLLIIVISILEVVTIVVDKAPPSFRWINIIANYLGFGLSPIVPVCLAAALGKNRSIKYAFMIETAYLVFLAATFPLKVIYYVDQNNQYMRGTFFGIYLLVRHPLWLVIMPSKSNKLLTAQCTWLKRKTKRSCLYSIGVCPLTMLILCEQEANDHLQEKRK